MGGLQNFGRIKGAQKGTKGLLGCIDGCAVPAACIIVKTWLKSMFKHTGFGQIYKRLDKSFCMSEKCLILNA